MFLLWGWVLERAPRSFLIIGFCLTLSKSEHSDNSIIGNQVKVSLHLFLLQVWVRLTDVPGLCWISWRFSVHSVDAGHWYRRIPATAPHRRKRREFQSVNPTSVSLGSVASSNLSPVNSSQNELWSTRVVRNLNPSPVLLFAFDWC